MACNKQNEYFDIHVFSYFTCSGDGDGCSEWSGVLTLTVDSDSLLEDLQLVSLLHHPWPIRDQYNLCQPIRDQHCLCQPIRDQYYLCQPIRDQYYLCQPIRDQYYLCQPIRDTRTMYQPIRREYYLWRQELFLLWLLRKCLMKRWRRCRCQSDPRPQFQATLTSPAQHFLNKK